MGKYFGTDGIRGKTYEFLSPELAFRVGNALTRKHGNIKVLIGRDTRISGKLICYSLACGVMAGGGEVTDVGIITTPGVAYLTKRGDYDYGIMITASHNSAEYNGIKIFDRVGNKISEADELEIERELSKVKYRKFDKTGKYLQENKSVKKYERYLTGPSCRLDRFKIVLDCANGASGKIAPDVFRSLGAEVVAINTSKNGMKINEKCGALHPEKLAEKVKQIKADIGLAFDGDADRLIVIDEKGEIFDGDNLIYLFAKFLKSQNMLRENTIVVTEMSNMGLDKALEKEDIKVIRTKVGDKYVAERLREGYSFGGEQCGHLIFGNNATSGDGIWAGLMLLNILSIKFTSLSQITKIKPFFQFKQDFKVKNKEESLKNKHILAFLENCREVLRDNGRILLRASGTEDKLRLLVESSDEKMGKDVFTELSNLITKLEK